MKNLLIMQENEFSVPFNNAAIVYSCRQTRHKLFPNMFPSPIS